MRNKRIPIHQVARVATRILFAGAFVFVVSGLLLSAISLPVLASANAAGSNQYPPPPTQTTCPCGTTTPIAGVTHTPGSGGSSLVFTTGCNCSCANVQAVVCNLGSSNMKGPVPWALYYSADSNPVLGKRIQEGQLQPLAVGMCTTLNMPPPGPGFYAYVVKQEAERQGPSTVWSNSCQVLGTCFGATATPGGPTQTAVGPTRTAVVPSLTFTPPPVKISPTPSATSRPPLAYNLSPICGYAGDTTMLWKVANHTAQSVEYSWRVTAGSSEGGSSTAPANGDDYFTTSASAQTVQILVGDDVVDQENTVAPCKQNLVLSYACTGNGLVWSLNNPNSTELSFTWSLDNGEGGRGTLAANSTVQFAATQVGAHTVTVEWSDGRLGTHRVTLSSPANSCAVTPTPVTQTALPPTLTFTPPPVQISLTPTNTLPASTVTATATATNTGQLSTVTPTPTSTNTAPPLQISLTPTVSATATNTVQPSTATSTPTNTNTAPAVQISLTPTNTNTPPAATATATATATSTLPPVLTSTSTFTAVPLQLPTFTDTPQGAYPAPATPIPSATAIPSNTPVPTNTQIATVAPPVVVSTPIIIPVTGADELAPARATGLLGRLFINIGLVMFGLALTLTGFTYRKG